MPAWSCPSWASASEPPWPWAPCSAWAPAPPAWRGAGPSRCRVRSEREGAARSTGAPVAAAPSTRGHGVRACPARPGPCHLTCASPTSCRRPGVRPRGARAGGHVGPQVLPGWGARCPGSHPFLSSQLPPRTPEPVPGERRAPGQGRRTPWSSASTVRWRRQASGPENRAGRTLASTAALKGDGSELSSCCRFCPAPDVRAHLQSAQREQQR